MFREGRREAAQGDRIGAAEQAGSDRRPTVRANRRCARGSAGPRGFALAALGKAVRDTVAAMTGVDREQNFGFDGPDLRRRERRCSPRAPCGSSGTARRERRRVDDTAGGGGEGGSLWPQFRRRPKRRRERSGGPGRATRLCDGTRNVARPMKHARPGGDRATRRNLVACTNCRPISAGYSVTRKRDVFPSYVRVLQRIQT